jgi:TRAP-type C4-dicarboxylate transport system substrate-binding protein
VQSLRLFEVQQYLSLTGHWWTGFTLLAHAPTWQTIPRAMRQVIERNAEKFARLQRQDVERVNAAGADALARHGMQVNTADKAAIRAALGDFYVRWRARFTPAAWALFEAAADDL